MIVKIDTREQNLLQQMNKLIATIPIFNKIIVQSETLPIGDIIICDGDTEKLIIERKSVADLQSSIKDGRYEEQSYRLNGLNHHNHNIIYLIEGNLNNPYNANRFKSENTGVTEKLTLFSAMFSLNYYKGFSVFRSFSLEETATIICNMAYKLEKESTTKKAFYQIKLDQITSDQLSSDQIPGEEPVDPQESSYVNVIKKVKKENITCENIGAIMLCQIPGVSSATAITIMEKYKTIQNLIKELETNPDTLKDISSTNAKGQTRKINKSSIANIIQFLIQSEK
uniref:ERCC4 domain-containing protein n=1 Tax=viral metagenome TaxID=1070528 RepID=A0A6C0AR26_9ZZZZ